MNMISMRLICVLMALGLGGCRGLLPEPTPPAAPAAEIERAVPVPAGATLYRIDSTESRVDILVFRGGTLARLGHNHVISVRNLTGHAWIDRASDQAGFELAFPVADLVVDDDQARLDAGEDFPLNLSDSDKEATRRNMLRPEVLDAEEFPTIRLRSVSASGQSGSSRASVAVTIKDASRVIELPISLTPVDDRLEAEGVFRILQSDFGITPFSAALGALTVEDELEVRFRIAAVSAGAAMLRR